MKINKCIRCQKDFKYAERGCKLKPYRICARCVRLDKEFKCNNCLKVQTLRTGYLDECWICMKRICSSCAARKEVIKKVSFAFCKNHTDIDIKVLEGDAEMLRQQDDALYTKNEKTN